MLRALLSVLGGRVAGTALQALTLVLVARVAGPADFVVFSALFGALQFLQAVIDCGASGFLLANYWRTEEVRRVLLVGRRISVVTALAVTPVLLFLAWRLHSDVLLALTPLGVWVAAERTCEIRSVLLIARKDMSTLTIAWVSRRAFVFAVVLLSLVIPEYWAWLFSCASALSSVLVVVYLNIGERELHGRETAPITSKETRALLSRLRPFWSASVSQQIRQIDVAILASVLPAVAVTYAPASRLGTPLRLLPATYAQVLLPRLANERRRADRHDYLVSGAVSALLYAPLAALSGIWVPILLGVAYSGSSFTISLVVVSLIPYTFACVATSSLQANGCQRHAAYGGWAGGISLVVLVPALAACFGPAGCGYANICSSLVSLAVLLMGGRKPGEPSESTSSRTILDGSSSRA